MNDNLEKKLEQGLNTINTLLNENGNIHIICIMNNKILVDGNNEIINFDIPKKDINKDKITYYLNQITNCSFKYINEINFNIYNDFNKRYYIYDIDKDELLNINSNYFFTGIENINNSEDLNVIKSMFNK